MSGSGDFSVATAGALVLGGVAAVILAVFMVTKDRARKGDAHVAASTTSVSPAAPALTSAAGALQEGEIEYQLDSNEAPGSEQP